jgi:hypothetical protein
MAWSNPNKLGLALLAACGLVNMIPFPMPDEAEAGPPLGVLIAAGILGLIAVIAVVHAWRTGNKRSVWIAVVVSILNALLAVPAFFVDGVPSGVRMLVGVFIVATVLGIALALRPNRATA